MKGFIKFLKFIKVLYSAFILFSVVMLLIIDQLIDGQFYPVKFIPFLVIYMLIDMAIAICEEKVF